MPGNEEDTSSLEHEDRSSVDQPHAEVAQRRSKSPTIRDDDDDDDTPVIAIKPQTLELTDALHGLSFESYHESIIVSVDPIE